MYKVFINEKIICFTNNAKNYNHFYNCVVLKFFNTTITPFLLDLLSHGRKIEVIVVSVDDYEAAFTQFQSQFKMIFAAGGIVTNAKGKKLFIYRLDKWDLPKGKIEKGEDTRSAAIREVNEECGVTNLMIKKEFPPTYHIYTIKNELVLKQTSWFEMESSFEGELIPQIEENITKAEWLNDEDIKNKVLKNTYSSIANLLSQVF
ncbi:MAG: NUDIX hydrolase [Flavobacteriales bacterium CG_4_10_14_0_2_um_filter_32_8]|nr:MAG: NUDIX hydrolase [Flavobacteriales bacterium CG_4_10_14_0_2_um_filter_32_8]PJB14764.1 MAG: NUDIX hydrolase [Flavobacteriales bacterium CG_4_9_14_3_um_filter_32_8]